MQYKVNNISDYAGWFGTTVDRLEKDFYNETACGAWITWDDKSLTIGSIVEGSEAEFSKTFCFPTTAEAIDLWVWELEEMCEKAWIEANVPDDLYDDEEPDYPIYNSYEDDYEVQYGWYQQDMIDMRYIER